MGCVDVILVVVRGVVGIGDVIGDVVEVDI